MGNKRSFLFYLGKEDYRKAYHHTSSELKKILNSTIGQLGSNQYLPSRAKNISQLIDLDSNYNLLLDDDIMVNPSQKNKESLIAIALNKTQSQNSISSVNLGGFPDLSLLQLLERSIIGERSYLHKWNEDNSQFSLSGGFLLYPKIKDLIIFPKVYNEDFLWVAINCVKNEKNALKLPLEIDHSPIKLKTLSSERLDFEATGEIMNNTINKINIKNFIKYRRLPSKNNITLSISEYNSYLDYLIDLVSKNDKNSSIISPFLKPIPNIHLKKILDEHLIKINQMTFNIIQKEFQIWTQEQLKWDYLYRHFSNILVENSALLIP